MSHSRRPRGSSERPSIKPYTMPLRGELEGDEKEDGGWTGALNQSD